MSLIKHNILKIRFLGKCIFKGYTKGLNLEFCMQRACGGRSMTVKFLKLFDFSKSKNNLIKH